MIKKLYNYALDKFNKNKMFYTYLLVGGFSTMVNFFVYWYFADIIGFKALSVSLVFTPTWFFFRYFINKKIVFKR